MAIRVRLDHDDDPLYDAMLTSDVFRLALAELGVILGPELTLPDLVLVGHKRFHGNQDLYLNSEIPLALYGSYDFGSVPHPFRVALESDLVSRLIQGASLRTLEEHNAPWKDQYRHGCFIEPAAEGCTPPPLSMLAHAKIRVWAGFAVTAATSKNFQGLPEAEGPQRPIKLHAVMNTHYASDLLIQHRLKALEAVREYMHRDFSSVLVGRSTGDVRSMCNLSYRRTMQECIAVLSPWGWGEYCVRDFEAVLAGCVVIKPDTSFSQTWPLFNPGEHYIPCRPDFLDLPECLEAAIKRSCDVQWRRYMQAHIQAAADPRLLAQRFRDCLIG